MEPTVTERSNCRFVVRKNESDKPQIVLELFQVISQLKDATLGYELLGGVTIEQAKKVAAVLNDHVLNLFVETGSAVRKS
jgi:hypothetical protein